MRVWLTDIRVIVYGMMAPKSPKVNKLLIWVRIFHCSRFPSDLPPHCTLYRGNKY
jgi:hypothetical protein